MECLRQSGYESGACRQRAMAYLECRMERQVGARRRRGEGGEGQPGGPRGGEAVGLPLRGGEGKGTRSGGDRAGGSCPCKGQVSFVASAVSLAFVFDGV